MEVLDEKTALNNPENPVMSVADGSIDFNNVWHKILLIANPTENCGACFN